MDGKDQPARSEGGDDGRAHGRVHAIFHAANVGIVVTNRAGEFVEANEAFLALFGYSLEELRALPGAALWADPEERTRLLAVLEREGEVVGFEVRATTKSGQPRWVSIYAHPIEEDGRHLLLSVITDVTERKRAEEALRESETIFERFLEYSPIYVFFKDEQIRALRLSRNYETMLGRPLRELLGKSMDDLFPSDLAKSMIADDQRILRNGEVVTVTEEFDGRTYWTTKFPILIDGKPRFLAGYTVDVTEREKALAQSRHLEAQLHQSQKMEAIGRLSGGIAHDFNNLLTAIRGNAALALEKDPGGPATQYLRDIEDASDRATRLTAQLLAYGRRQVIEPRVLDLNGVVTGMQRMLERLLGEHVRIDTALAPDLWPVKVDSSQIDQLLLNLALNARDAMPGGGRLTFATRNASVDGSAAASYASPGDYAVLIVADTGHGMDESTLAHVFEPFYTTKPRGEGTGLGLATVYGIVKQHGGAIEVDSAPGRGATFSIFLPRAHGAPPLAAPPPREAPAIVGGHETLLLVEDDPDVATVLRRLLEPTGYFLLAAESGDAALRIANQHPGPIHLLVTDVVMPGMGGPELADKLRARRPDIRVLFVSGYTEDAIGDNGVLPPGMHFLGKPYTRKSLTTKIRAVLDDRDEPSPENRTTNDGRDHGA